MGGEGEGVRERTKAAQYYDQRVIQKEEAAAFRVGREEVTRESASLIRAAKKSFLTATFREPMQKMTKRGGGGK